MCYVVIMCVKVCLTFDGVSGQAQLADDVPRNVGFHQVTLLGVVLGRLQQVVKLLRVELLTLEEKIFLKKHGEE